MVPEAQYFDLERSLKNVLFPLISHVKCGCFVVVGIYYPKHFLLEATDLGKQVTSTIWTVNDSEAQQTIPKHTAAFQPTLVTSKPTII